MNNLALFIKEHREKLNISKRKLSELSNVSHTEIQRLENGHRKSPSPPLLRSIANALNVRYEDIMAAAGYLDTTSESMVPTAWLPYLEDLTSDELKQVMTFIEFLRAKRKKKRGNLWA